MSDSASLAAVLAQTTARLLHWSTDQETYVAGSGAPGDYIDHSYQLCFEIATDALTRLGAMRHVRGPIYQLIIDAGDTAGFIAAAASADAPPLDDIISAFLGMADLRGLLPMQHDAVFEPPETCRAAMRALDDAGYAEGAGSLFSWCETIRPAMRLQHLWPAAPTRS